MGGDLAYTVHGDDGEPIVFLHGFMGSSTDWQPVIASFPNRRCIAVDAPGHGGSKRLPEEAYTMAGASERLAAVLDAEGARRAVIVGYSMGGRWALYFALHHPTRLRRLVLESASPGLPAEAARAARRADDAERARAIEADFQAFLDDWYRMPLFVSLANHPETLAQMVERRQRNDPAELARSLRGMGTGTQPSLWERLGGLRVHTLAVAGALDAKYVEVARRMAERSARIDAAIVPEAGHNVHAERPAAFAELLSSFLTQA